MSLVNPLFYRLLRELLGGVMFVAGITIAIGIGHWVVENNYHQVPAYLVVLILSYGMWRYLKERFG